MKSQQTSCPKHETSDGHVFILTELWAHICGFLSPPDKLQFGSTCKRFHEIVCIDEMSAAWRTSLFDERVCLPSEIQALDPCSKWFQIYTNELCEKIPVCWLAAASSTMYNRPLRIDAVIFLDVLKAFVDMYNTDVAGAVRRSLRVFHNAHAYGGKMVDLQWVSFENENCNTGKRATRLHLDLVTSRLDVTDLDLVSRDAMPWCRKCLRFYGARTPRCDLRDFYCFIVRMLCEPVHPLEHVKEQLFQILLPDGCQHFPVSSN